MNSPMTTLLRLTLLTVLTLAMTAAPASATARIGKAGGVITYNAAAGDVDVPIVSEVGANIRFTAGSGGAPLDDDAGCSAVGAAVECPTAGTTSIVLNLGDRDDDATGSLAAGIPWTVNGDAGSDVLRSSGGNDTLNGGSDGDILDGGTGKDLLQGGDGYDRADYSSRAATVEVTVGDGDGNDGEAGEQDTVSGDVEDVSGGTGNDVLVGTDGPNVIDGRAGNDKITPKGGADIVFAGGGGDEIFGEDGAGDSISCGEGVDLGHGDLADQFTADCDTVTRNNSQDADRDQDGASAAVDCDEGNPLRYPGAPDYFDNGVDENCDGADAHNFDVDGDGYSPPYDCNDRDPNIKPTKPEIYDNKIDENCDGKMPAAQHQKLTIQNRWTMRRTGAIMEVLTVRGALIDSEVEVRCKGKRCPTRKENSTVQRRFEPQEFQPAFGRKMLRFGTVITITVSKEGGYLTEINRFTLRRSGVRQVRTCIRPGELKEGPCAKRKKKRRGRR